MDMEDERDIIHPEDIKEPTINVVKFHKELKDANIPIEGVCENGRIDFLPEATKSQRKLAIQLLTVHDPKEPKSRDYSIEIDELKARIEILETRRI